MKIGGEFFLFRKAVEDAIKEVDRCPDDSISDIFNEKFQEWEVPYKMDSQLNIDRKEEVK